MEPQDTANTPRLLASVHTLPRLPKRDESGSSRASEELLATRLATAPGLLGSPPSRGLAIRTLARVGRADPLDRVKRHEKPFCRSLRSGVRL